MGYFINARDRPHRSKSLKSLISPDKICIIVNLLLSSQTGSPCRKPVTDVGGLQKGMSFDDRRMQEDGKMEEHDKYVRFDWAARRMRSLGTSSDIIAPATGLAPEEIARL